MKRNLTQDEVYHYSRHLVLPEVGIKGQKKLKESSVLVVGTGGLGSPISMYLAAAGVGRIGLVDYDVVDTSNLQRQIVHSEKTVGWKKVQSAAERLNQLNKHIQIEVYEEVFEASNARRIAQDYSVFVDGTDNFPTRYLLNDLAVLSGKPYVYGSVFRFEGQVSVFDAHKGPCYRCLFPQPPEPGVVPSCVEAGVLGVTPGIVGTLEAAEAIKLLLGIGNPLIGRLLLIDVMDMDMQTVRIQKNPSCPLCGRKPVISDLVDYPAFCGSPAAYELEPPLAQKFQISSRELERMIKNGEKITILDIRSPEEARISRLPRSVLVGGKLEEVEARIRMDGLNVIVCRIGQRSARITRKLVEGGHENVKSLAGGINAWAEQVDHSMWRY
jgi:molybdopterin/thiamine biosynthesis adenylyltransferase/rhodanese-related sulfurtransferase